MTVSRSVSISSWPYPFDADLQLSARPLSFRVQSAPVAIVRNDVAPSSLLSVCLPLVRFYFSRFPSVVLVIHLLSFTLTMLPARLHFVFMTCLYI